MAQDITKKNKLSRSLNYLNKDFDAFRSDLLQYAQVHFSDQIRDFSEASLGGLLIDMAAYVGDVMSYYVDHQYNELNLETAIEDENIERLVRNSGVKIYGSSPAQVICDIYLRVRSKLDSLTGEYIPDPVYLPNVKAGSIVAASNGISFELLEDIDFLEVDKKGNYLFNRIIGNRDAANPSIINDYIVYKSGRFTSAKSYTEGFSIGATHQPFRTITLAQEDVNEIVSVIDSEGNEYYEVENLSHDTVFARTTNTKYDSDEVSDNLIVKPAPRRFVTQTSYKTGLTTLRFGSGRSDTYDDDIIPNPSDHALPLYGDKKTFSNFAIDPNVFLDSQTLGVAPINTRLTVRYRAGGGSSHNVNGGEINSIRTLSLDFNESGLPSLQRGVRNSIEVSNLNRANGGLDRPTLDELRNIGLSFKGSQNRIVTSKDLLARVYTMPAKFGRAYRVGIASNPFNNNAVSLTVLTRNKDGYLDYASDTLKENISKYLNEFRLIGDAIDILDAPITNFGINFTVTVNNNFHEASIISKAKSELLEYLKTENFQIDQPISLSSIQNLLYNVDGVSSVIALEIIEKSGIVDEKIYSDFSYDVEENTSKGLIYPIPGGMFELKYPNDIIGRIV